MKKNLLALTLLWVTKLMLAQPGTLDPTYGGGDGKATFAVINAVHGMHDMGRQSTGKIVFAGEIYTGNGSNMAIVWGRMLPDGTMDPTFHNGGFGGTDFFLGQEERVARMVVLPDDKFLMAGFGGNPSSFWVARFLPDGEPDVTFGINGMVKGNPVILGDMDLARDMVVQPDGKIIISGLRHAHNYTDDFALIRLNADGSRDYSFSYDAILTLAMGVGSANDDGRTLALQPDGKIVVGGSWVVAPSIYSFGLARFMSDGSLDNSFGINGIVNTPVVGNSCIPNSILIQPDGKIVLAGNDEMPAAPYNGIVARYLSNGALDHDFGNGTGIATFNNAANDQILAIALQPDGKIIAAGTDELDFWLFRLHPNGDLDGTFNNGYTDFFGADDYAEARSVLLVDDKIYIGGSVEAGPPYGNWVFGIARYNNDIDVSQLCAGFGMEINPSNVSVCAGHQTVLTASAANTYNWSNGATTQQITVGVGSYTVTGTNANGCTASATSNVISNPLVNDVTPPSIACPLLQFVSGYDSATLPDFSGMATTSDNCGSVSVSQLSPAPGTVYTQSELVTVTLLATDDTGNTSTCAFDVEVVVNNDAGVLNFDFDGDGLQSWEFSNGDNTGGRIAVQSTGKIVLAGYGYGLGGNTTGYYGFQRLFPDGALDTTFNGGGSATFDPTAGPEILNDMEMLCNDEMIVVVAMPTPHLAKFSASGHQDMTFGVNGYVALNANYPNFVNDLVIQPDGKMLVCGRKSGPPNVYNYCIGRLNADGSPDNTFGNGGAVTINNIGISYSQAKPMAVYPDGRIVVAGLYVKPGGLEDYFIVRHFADGSLDNSFGVGGVRMYNLSPNGNIPNALLIQPDGKILVGGNENITPGYGLGLQNSMVIRCNLDGSLDNTFANSGIYIQNLAGGNEQIIGMKLQPDGKILACGELDQDFLLIRLLPDGTLDPVFDNGGTDFYNRSDAAYSLAVYEDKIYVGGATTEALNNRVFGYANYRNDINIPHPSQAFTINITPDNATVCPGQQAVLTAPAAYYYSWSTGDTGASITAGIGNYSVTASDFYGCSASATAQITAAPDLNIPITGNTSFCVGGNTVLTASGADTYTWSTGATTASITVSVAGTYNVTGNDVNGCSGTASVTVIENAAPSISINGNVTICAGQTTILTATGGNGYSWSNGATTASITVGAGTFSVTGTDANGCTGSTSVTVTENAAPSISINGVLTICAGQTTILTATGGNGYSWSNGATTASITVGAGTFTVTGTDANGCSGSISATVIVNAAPILSAIITQPTCNQSNGAVDLTVTGTQPIAYAWSNGATTEDITGLSPNVYEISVTDGNGCTASAGAIVVASPDVTAPTITCPANQSLNGQFSVTLPDYIGLATASDDCGNATIAQTSPAPGTTYNTTQTVTVTLTATDDSGNTSACSFDVLVTIDGCNFTASINPSSITICPGANTTLTASAGASWAWSNGDTNQSITVGVGTYSVTVDDGAGCSAVATATVTESSPMTFNGVGDGTCAGESNGSVTITITGGTAPYNYDFGFGGTTDNSITGLAAGTYNCTVTDAIGCTIVAQSVVPTFDSPAVSISGTNATCAGNDGVADLSVSGGAGNYSYLWSNGATSEDLAGLAQGSYFVTVTDGNGCTGTATVTIGLAADVVAPSLVCPSNQTLSGAVSVILPDYSGMATATDNCGGVTISQTSPAPGTVYNATQSVTVVLTATDGSGNTTDCVFNVDITISGNPCAPMAGVIFVNDNAVGANNGNTWVDAFTDLQSALAVAVSGDVVWVAEGTYKPGVAASSFFAMKAGVDLYGGFADAGCPDLNSRDWVLYPTVLSGDIGVIGDPSDNSRRVVQCKNIGSDVRVDGFIIRDALSASSGGGIGITADAGTSSPYFEHCVIRDNTAPGKGAGCYVYSLNGGVANPRFRDCQFTGNNTTANDGAGLTTLSQTGGSINAWVVDCSFDNNIADQKGGAISNWINGGGSSTITIDSSNFNNNTASTNGGAIWSYARTGGSGQVAINACAFNGNTAGNGSAVHSQTLSAGSLLITEVENCSFNSNSSPSGYGAICTYGQSNSTAITSVEDCSFVNNIAGNGGGVACVALTGSSTTVNIDRCWFENNTAKGGGVMTNSLNVNSLATTNASNCVFYNNSSLFQGGAVSSSSSTSGSAFTNLTNCTFHSNMGTSVGGAVNNNAAASATTGQVSAVNCIFWDNPALKAKAQSFYTNGVPATTTVTNCVLDSVSCASNNSGNGAFNCVASFASNPLFVNAGSGDLHLQNASPAIDGGTNVGLTWDYDGNIRPVGNGFDIGAYEYQGPRPAARLTQIESFATATIFPNPTMGLAEVRFSQPVSGLLEVTAVDGRSVFVQKLQNTSTASLNLEEQATGLYLVRIIEKDHITTLKLVNNK